MRSRLYQIAMGSASFLAVGVGYHLIDKGANAVTDPQASQREATIVNNTTETNIAVHKMYKDVMNQFTILKEYAQSNNPFNKEFVLSRVQEAQAHTKNIKAILDRSDNADWDKAGLYDELRQTDSALQEIID